MSVEFILGIWLIGLGCLSVELFVASITMGVAGLVLFMGSIVAMFMSPDGGVAWGAGLSLTSLVAGGVIVKIAATRLTHRHTLGAADGYVGTDDLSPLLGQEGVSSTLLRPGGRRGPPGAVQLERDEPIEVGVSGQVHRAHGALPQAPNNLVATNGWR